MNRFTRVSGRRKTLFVLVAAILLLVGALRWLGVAGLNGTQAREMDWNADGEVGRVEILQAYTAVVVRESVEGNRSCRSYAWVRDRANPIRVDCRMTFDAGGEQAAAQPH